jgi:hypothetical protein
LNDDMSLDTQPPLQRAIVGDRRVGRLQLR